MILAAQVCPAYKTALLQWLERAGVFSYSLQSYMGKCPTLKHQKTQKNLLNFILAWSLTH